MDTFSFACDVIVCMFGARNLTQLHVMFDILSFNKLVKKP